MSSTDFEDNIVLSVSDFLDNVRCNVSLFTLLSFDNFCFLESLFSEDTVTLDFDRKIELTLWDFGEPKRDV